jgi:hypothetical protein
MGKEIQLDGAEVTILKALGFGGADLAGETLMERAGNMEFAELADAMEGLVSAGYVISDRDGFKTAPEFERTLFRINSGYSRELKSALDPTQRDQPKSRRVRRE